ncbi:hypothetical protein WMY93_000297 [Mugilogobius chulae]|uniref:L1 transposable element RRM domain-containing protein n=1 Tax=Mugilogobius chulae TaxID=88201 RepID=A0AAW0QDW3_9GOBI
MATPVTRNQANKQLRGGPQASSTLAPIKPDDTEAEADMLTAAMLTQALNNLKESVCEKIGNDISDMKSDLSKNIDSVKSELATSVASIHATLASHDTRIQDLESSVTFTGDTVTSLHSTVAQLQKEVGELRNKCDDLEGRSRRNNLRLVGVEEGVERGHPTKFISELLKEILKLDVAPLLDRAHRSLQPKPKQGEPPRVFLMHVHYTHVRDEILRRSNQQQLVYMGRKVHIFPDFTSSVARRRAAFGEVKKRLRSLDGVKYGLRFPATLRITFPGKKERTFIDSKLAMDFIDNELGDPGANQE